MIRFLEAKALLVNNCFYAYEVYEHKNKFINIFKLKDSDMEDYVVKPILKNFKTINYKLSYLQDDFAEGIVTLIIETEK